MPAAPPVFVTAVATKATRAGPTCYSLRAHGGGEGGEGGEGGSEGGSEGGGGEGGGEGGVVVAEVLQEGSAARMGVRQGDLLLAVNNQDVSAAPLECVLERISSAPGRVLNLRFARRR